MSTIKIKRSGTSGSPTALGQGEVAYSYLAGDLINGGDRLYIGTGTETAGVAANIDVIGGKYFTAKLDHTPGTLTANSAIITDINNKIDTINVSNITITGNTITTTATNTNLVLNPNGTGVIDVSGKRIINGAAPIANTDFVTLGYLDATYSANLTIAADTGITDVVTLLTDTLTFVGGVGLTSVVSNNTITFNLDNTAVTPGTYGSTSQIPVFTVDAQGRLTSASSVAVATNLSLQGDTGTDTVSLLTDTLLVTGNTGLTVNVTNNHIDIVLDPTTVTPGSYGSATSVSTFTVDTQGRLTAAGQTAIAIPHTQVTDFTIATKNVVGSMLTPTNQFGIAVTYDANNNLAFNVNDFTITLGGVLSGNVTITDLASGTLTAAYVPNSIVLGQDTQGAYVQALSAGTGVFLANTAGGTGGESAVPVISIGQDVSTTANVQFNSGLFTDSVTIQGNLTVSGNTTTINSTTLTVEDNFIYLNANATLNADPDIGWAGAYTEANTYAHAGMFRDQSDGIFKVFSGYTLEPQANVYIQTGDPSFHLADFQANTVHAYLAGNANTASALQTARTIALAGDVAGSVLFDGSTNVTIATTIQPNSVALGTDTTGNYIATIDVTPGTGLSITGNSGESAAVTIAGVAATTTSLGVASFSANNFAVTAGAVSISAIDGGTY